MQILQVPTGASDKEIKSAYRSLSRTHHPDRGGDAELFQKIAKAYEALTDPVARENYEKFGNPDGRQALEVSIGLPTWIIEGFGKWVLLLGYLGILVVAVPSYMWRMYSSSRKAGVGGVEPHTFEWLKFIVTPEIPARGMPLLLAGAVEALAPEVQLQQEDLLELKELRTALEGDGRMVKFNQPQHTAIPPEFLLRNLVLLHAHVCRVDIASPRLRAVVDAMLSHAEPIINLALEICVMRTAAPPAQKIPSHQETAMAVVEFSQMLTQRVWVGQSSLSTLLPADAAKRVSHLTKRMGGATTLLAWLKQVGPCLLEVLRVASFYVAACTNSPLCSLRRSAAVWRT